MLTTQVLQSLKNYSGERVCGTTLNIVANATVKGLLKKGQRLYRFNRDYSGLEVFVFVCFFDTLLDSGQSCILSRGTCDNHNDLFVNSYTVRDILLSTRGNYDNECFFVDEDIAKRRLKRYIKKKLGAQLLRLDKE